MGAKTVEVLAVMGRARSSNLAVVGARRFNTVLGGSRGSLAAQAHRDAAELQAQIQTFIDFKNKVAGIVGGDSPVVERLLRAYQRDLREKSGESSLTEVHATGLDLQEQLFTSLEAGATRVDEIVAVINLGDPHGFEGLTAPAVRALGECFASSRPRSNPVLEGVLDEDAQHIFTVCFDESYPLKHYQRLQPVFDGLRKYLEGMPSRRRRERLSLLRRIRLNQNTAKPQQISLYLWFYTAALYGPEATAGRELHLQAVEAVREAPIEALTGPLKGWVDYFVTRVDNNQVSDLESTALLAWVRGHEGDSEYEAAIKELTRRFPDSI